MFSPDFLSALAKFANVLIVAAFEMVWHEALADVLEKGKVSIADGNGELMMVVMVMLVTMVMMVMLGMLVMMAMLVVVMMVGMFLVIWVIMVIVMAMMVMMTMMAMMVKKD